MGLHCATSALIAAEYAFIVPAVIKENARYFEDSMLERVQRCAGSQHIMRRAQRLNHSKCICRSIEEVGACFNGLHEVEQGADTFCVGAIGTPTCRPST